VGIIPISTLDVTLETDTLWVKPSTVKKRKLIYRSRRVFIDEIEGTTYTFNQGEAGKIVSLTFVYEGEQYTAQRITIPAPSLKGNTTFRLKGYPEASIVALAGSFNNWNQTQFIFGREGDEWVCRIDLEPGKHAYKFIVDGNWLLDPANPNTEDDDYGVKNNVLLVTRDAPQPPIRVP
jgi:AMP-activated protein kinase-like protein